MSSVTHWLTLLLMQAVKHCLLPVQQKEKAFSSQVCFRETEIEKKASLARYLDMWQLWASVTREKGGRQTITGVTMAP